MNGKNIAIGLAGLVLATAVAVQARPKQPGTPNRAGAAPDGVRFQRVRLSTGVELEVAEHGPPEGRPVLFLHGYTDSWFSFTQILDHLPPDVRAIMPSQRGHGNSERPQCCYRIVDFARDAVALLDGLGIERAHIVGHSTGSFTAQRVAVEFPERVDRLVLLGSGTTHAVPGVIELNEAVQALPDPIPVSFIREFQESTARQPLPPAFLEQVIEESIKLPAYVWREGLTGALADPKVDLQRIQAKALVLSGEHDPLWNVEEQDALAAAIPDARLIRYREVSHAPHWEVPDRVGKDIADFLGQSADTPAGAERQ